jgi:L-histidine N-alpha-methyltransferase
MHLRPRSHQVVYVKGIDLKVDVRPEETIWTESSHKFTRESVTDMLRAAGMKLDRWFVSPAPEFGLALASRA